MRVRWREREPGGLASVREVAMSSNENKKEVATRRVRVGETRARAELDLDAGLASPRLASSFLSSPSVVLHVSLTSHQV